MANHKRTKDLKVEPVLAIKISLQASAIVTLSNTKALQLVKLPVFLSKVLTPPTTLFISSTDFVIVQLLIL